MDALVSVTGTVPNPTYSAANIEEKLRQYGNWVDGCWKTSFPFLFGFYLCLN